MNNTPTNTEEDTLTQESLALLQMLEISSADVEAGIVRDLEDVFEDARRKIAALRAEQA